MSKNIIFAGVFILILLSLVLFYFNTRSHPSSLDNNSHLHKSKTVHVAIATWAGFASGFIGNEKGKDFFGDLNVEFTTMDDTPARHTAFQSGQVDVMVSSADVFAQEKAQGINGVIFLVTDESFGGDGIVAKTDITEIAQLRGRTVAFARGTPSHYLLYKALQRAKLTPTDIQSVIVDDPSHVGQTFLSGSADAAVTFEPMLTQVRESGKGRLLLTTRDQLDTIVDVLVATPALAQDKETLQKFIQGWIRCVQYIPQHPEESRNIIAHGLGVSPGDAEGMMAGLRFSDAERNRYFLCGKNPRINGILLDAAEFWQSQKIIDKAPNLEGILSDVFSQSPLGEVGNGK